MQPEKSFSPLNLCNLHTISGFRGFLLKGKGPQRRFKIIKIFPCGWLLLFQIRTNFLVKRYFKIFQISKK